jgi:glutathione peroxidase
MQECFEGNMTIHRRTILGILISIQTVVALSAAPSAHKSVYDYSLVALDGKEVSLSAYKDKVLLIVNLASQSIYKTQISALEELQKLYGDKGLVVVGIPSGDFGGQELADNKAIQGFYLDSQHVTFQVFSKASLRGKDSIPLIHFLVDPKEGTGGGDIHWNYTKFLVDRKGQPVLRFEADSDPGDPEFRVTLEEVLNGTFKKKSSPKKDSSTPPDEEEDGNGE